MAVAADVQAAQINRESAEMLAQVERHRDVAQRVIAMGRLGDDEPQYELRCAEMRGRLTHLAAMADDLNTIREAAHRLQQHAQELGPN